MYDLEKISEDVFNCLKGLGKELQLMDEKGKSTLDPKKAIHIFFKPDRALVTIWSEGDIARIVLNVPPTFNILDPKKSLTNDHLKTNANSDHYKTLASKFQSLQQDDEASENQGTSAKVKYDTATASKTVKSNPLAANALTDQEKVVKALKNVSISNKVMFDIKKFGKEISPKDFAFLTATTEEASNSKEIVEAKRFMTGTTKSSFQKWDTAKLIVRHTKAVNEETKGARSRNISKIFIETKEGERLMFPTSHLSGAKAMARHVGSGGQFNDKVGSYIINLSEEFSDLKEVSSYIFRNRVKLEEVDSIREVIRLRMSNIREDLETFLTKRFYFKRLDEINNLEKDASTINEEDISEKLNQLKTKLKVREENTKMLSALTRVIPLLKEDAVTEELTSDIKSLENTIKKAYGRTGLTGKELKTFEEDVSAAAKLLKTKKFKFSRKFDSSETMKPGQMTPLAKLGWRLGAVAERLDPAVPGQVLLSNILARISDKINETKEGKVHVTQEQKDLIDLFIKEIAPTINESTKQKVNTMAAYKEQKEILAWFESFDPLAILERKALEEKAEECICEQDCDGSNCKCEPCHGKKKNESQVQKMLNAGLIESNLAYHVADKLVRGKRTIQEVAYSFNQSAVNTIIKTLEENFKEEVSKPIIDELKKIPYTTKKKG